MLSKLVVVLLSATAYAALPEGYVVPGAHEAHEEKLGPVLRTGRYRVIQERVLGQESYQSPPNLEKPWMQGHPEIPASSQHYQYQGPIDGRRVYIYRRVHTPVRVNNGVIERLGPGQTVERWAEGGYKGAQNHNLEVYHRVGTDVYSDRVIPVKEGGIGAIPQ